MLKNEKTVGILGGMGPEATIDLMQRILRLTPALDDIDHIRCIVDNNPKIPSRIKAIIDGGGEDPGPCMADMARRLESWGADYLAIPCNTAHHYFETISNAVTIPIINLIDIVVSHILKTDPNCRKIGMLASTAVQITGLYENRCRMVDIDVVYPKADFQKKLFEVIKEVKAGNKSKAIVQHYQEVCNHLHSLGVESAIVACTELGVIACDFPFTLTDAAEILAQKIVNTSKNILDEK